MVELKKIFKVLCISFIEQWNKSLVHAFFMCAMKLWYCIYCRLLTQKKKKKEKIYLKLSYLSLLEFCSSQEVQIKCGPSMPFFLMYLANAPLWFKLSQLPTGVRSNIASLCHQHKNLFSMAAMTDITFPFEITHRELAQQGAGPKRCETVTRPRISSWEDESCQTGSDNRTRARSYIT